MQKDARKTLMHADLSDFVGRTMCGFTAAGLKSQQNLVHASESQIFALQRLHL
jgi:hypothetical protein